MNKVSAIIPTMQKNTNILDTLIKQLIVDDYVGEIIVIDNSLQGYSNSSDKVKIIIPESNLYVNPSWNYGISIAKYKYWALLNDDIILPPNFIGQVINFIAKTKDCGVVGLESSSSVQPMDSNDITYPKESILSFKKIENINSEGNWYWGSAIFGKKSNYYNIPKNILINSGDGYLIYKNRLKKKQNYAIYGTVVKHYGSLTSSAQEFKAIRQKDIEIFKSFAKEYYKTKPKVSIIVTVYNTEKYLRECLDSIINQTLKDIEIICVNDGSTDNSPAILNEYANKDDRFIIINQKNKGPGGAINSGLKKVTSDYLMIVDSDDYMNSDCCESLYNNMINNDVDFVLSYAKNYAKTLSKNIELQVKTMENITFQSMLPDGINNYDFKKDKKLRTAPFAKLYKMDIIKKYNITFPENLIQEDDAFYWYYMIHVKSIYSNTKRMYNRLIHEDSIMYKKNFNNNKILDHLKIHNHIYEYLQKNEMYEKYNEIFKQSFYSVCNSIEKNKNLTPKDIKEYTKLKTKLEYKFKFKHHSNSIFSVKNEDIRKVITIFGIKIKFKSNKLIERKRLEKIENKLKKIKEKYKQQNEKIKRQKKKFQNQNEKIRVQKEKINQQNNQIFDLKEKINQQDNQIFDLKEKINQINQEILKINNETLKIRQTPSITELAMMKTKYHWDDIKIPVIKNNFQTIEELKNSEKSLIRFGDGEFSIIEGNDICFQNHNAYISDMLKEILYNNDENLLTGIPEPYYDYPINLCDVSKKFVLDWFPKWHKIIEKYINYDKTYYSTHISQSFPIYKEYDFEKHYFELKQIWDKKKIVIITGNRVYNNIEYNIFENAAGIDYIYGPTENAFEEFENLKSKISEFSKENILIFALGPAGKILAYHMYQKGYRVLDLGHLIKDYDFYKKSFSMTEEEWNEERKVFFHKD